MIRAAFLDGDSYPERARRKRDAGDMKGSAAAADARVSRAMARHHSRARPARAGYAARRDRRRGAAEARRCCRGTPGYAPRWRGGPGGGAAARRVATVARGRNCGRRSAAYLGRGAPSRQRHVDGCSGGSAVSRRDAAAMRWPRGRGAVTRPPPSPVVVPTADGTAEAPRRGSDAREDQKKGAMLVASGIRAEQADAVAARDCRPTPAASRIMVIPPKARRARLGTMQTPKMQEDPDDPMGDISRRGDAATRSADGRSPRLPPPGSASGKLAR